MFSSTRQVFALLVVATIALMAYAFYAQYVMQLVPCTYCMVQRFAMVMTGVVCTFGVIHEPKSVMGWRIYSLSALFFALFGAAAAAKHVYIQYLPMDKRPGCGPSVDFMLQNMPLGKVLHNLFITGGDCGDIDWKFFGLTMPGWVLVWFVVFIVLVVWRGLIAPRLRNNRTAL
jgi:protein dithiol:quinone oxidoreductase